jgi:hypothetical protein
VKSETGVPKGDLTLTTTRNDPLNHGCTVKQHRRCQWGALLWKHAVSGRRDDCIHGRAVHYVAYTADIDIPTPNPTTEENPRGTDWDVYRNVTTCYSYLADSLKNARVLGYIPQNGIEDEKNERHTYTVMMGEHNLPSSDDLTVFGNTYLSALSMPSRPSFTASASPRWEGDYREWVVEMLTDRLLKKISIDHEAIQPFHIEVWSEKTLPSEVKSTVRRAGGGVIVEGEGCMSLTQAFEFGERVERAGKPGIVLYLADFDAAGNEMPAQVANKFEWLKRNPRVGLSHRVFVDRLALTAEQVECHDLPRQMVDPSDFEDAYATRVADFEALHGSGATELNALETDLSLYQRIVREGVEQYRDHTLTEKESKATAEFRDACKDAVHAAVDDTESDEFVADIKEWLDRVEDLGAEYEDAVNDLRSEFKEELDELKDDDAYHEFTSRHNDVGRAVDVPGYDVPDSDVSPPDDPLYDSQRRYLTTVERAQGHRTD